MTNLHPYAMTGWMYVKNGFWNAIGELFYGTDVNVKWATPTIHNSTDATILRRGSPIAAGGDPSFDPVNPDIRYHFSGSSIMQYSVSQNTVTTLKTFPAKTKMQNPNLKVLSLMASILKGV